MTPLTPAEQAALRDLAPTREVYATELFRFGSGLSPYASVIKASCRG